MSKWHTMQEQEASRDTACLPAAVKHFDRQNAFKATRNKCKVFEENRFGSALVAVARVGCQNAARQDGRGHKKRRNNKLT